MVAKRAYEPAIQFPLFLSLSLSSIKDAYTELDWQEHLRLINPKALVDHPEAILRNRHQSVLPWAYNRIHLRGLPYSFINASPMSVGEGEHREKFIACQGPLDSGHMWRMVWEQDVSVIVMLTLPVEDGDEKCLQYYPEDEEDVIDDDDDNNAGFRVSMAGKKSLGDSGDIRTLHIRHEGEQRTISHFLFKAWPDHGTPLGPDLATLFSIMDLSRAKNTSQKARVVHCSAGVGRTGTFIALEHLIREMDLGSFDTKCDNDAVFETVNSLREQRMRMVNERQLAMIYQILRERWEERQISKTREVEKSRKRLHSMPVNDTFDGIVYIEK